MPYALILFVAMPIIEIALLLRVGSALGWLPTLAIVIFTAVLGTAMLKQQGLATLNIARQRMNSGEMPAQQLIEGLLLVIGGVLLLTPGFVTDALGFACLVPFSRQWMASRIAARSVVGVSGVAGMAGGVHAGSSYRAQSGDAGTGAAGGPGDTRATSNRAGRHSGGSVIEGDFRQIDD